jgi:hypothetical protein
VTQYKLEIYEDASGSWTGLANLGNEIEPQTYRVFADSLEELRELVQEGVDGDLGIADISFKEVLLTNSEITS